MPSTYLALTEIGWDAYETCSRCSYSTYVEKEALDHDFATTLTQGETTHYYACSRCDAKDSEAAHDYDNEFDAICDACGYERVAATAVAKIGDQYFTSIEEAIRSGIDGVIDSVSFCRTEKGERG